MNGIVVIDKPAGVSSAGAVDRVKRAMGAKRAGHGGTLDPIATGVLVICLGEATKVASYLLADAKSYVAELVLGIETDTLDRTGEIVASHDASHVTQAMVQSALAGRIGEQDQVPPMFSAIKHRGVRLYQHARNGVEIEREPRRICISQLDLLAFSPPRMTLAISCSKGTYIRSLVSDLGRDLGCGGHLVELRRTRSGVFTIDQAVRLDSLENPGSVPRQGFPAVLPIEAALTLPIVKTSAALEASVRSGVQLSTTQFPALEGTPDSADRFQLRDESDRLIAVAHVDRGRLVYDRVFRTDL